jgi:hypothetical protein
MSTLTAAAADCKSKNDKPKNDAPRHAPPSPLKLAKILSGYTYAELAKRTGVHRIYLTQCLNGQRKPGAALQARLWEILRPFARAP